MLALPLTPQQLHGGSSLLLSALYPKNTRLCLALSPSQRLLPCLSAFAEDLPCRRPPLPCPLTFSQWFFKTLESDNLLHVTWMGLSILVFNKPRSWSVARVKEKWPLLGVMTPEMSFL